VQTRLAQLKPIQIVRVFEGIARKDARTKRDPGRRSRLSRQQRGEPVQPTDVSQVPTNLLCFRSVMARWRRPAKAAADRAQRALARTAPAQRMRTNSLRSARRRSWHRILRSNLSERFGRNRCEAQAWDLQEDTPQKSTNLSSMNPFQSGRGGIHCAAEWLQPSRDSHAMGWLRRDYCGTRISQRQPGTMSKMCLKIRFLP
jgi:hypothetical protein